MLKYKLICSDLDDTLVTNDGAITEEVKTAVGRYVAAGGRFCIVTGRMTKGAKKIYKQLNLDTETATYQGAIISDLNTGEIFYSECLTTKDAAEVADYIEGRGFYCQTYSGDNFLMRKANEYSVLYGKICGADFYETGMSLGEYIRLNNLTPPKVLVLEEVSKIPAFERELKVKFGDRFRINTSKPYIIEIIPKTVSKARAAEFIARRHGIKKEEIICVGDSDNDLPMIDFAGMGAVVANASEKVKAHADIIIPSNEESGVAWLIANFGLQEE